MNEIVNETDENYDWLTEKLFEPIIGKELRDHDRGDYELKLTSIKPAVGKGDNYVSLVTRVELTVNFINAIEHETKTYNFVVKSNKVLMKEFEEAGVFEKEISFYEDIVDKFRKIDDSITFLPMCYSITTQGRKIIILDDLTAKGFEMRDRLVGLDLDHCKIFYKYIAHYHALSAVYCEQFGRYPEQFYQSFYRLEMKTVMDQWNDIIYTDLLQIFDQYDSLKPYREKIHKWKDGIFEAVCEIMKEKPDQFNVLNHGDSWVNNMLIQHDSDNNPTGLCFVDFQLSMYGTPMIDILYFFATSPTLEVREHHFDELLQVYHASLNEHLTKYNYSKPIPTMHDLQMMMLKEGLLMSNYLFGIAPIVLLDPENSQLSDFFIKDCDEGRSFRYKLYHTPRYIKMLEVALKFLDRRGLLEF